MTSATSSKRIRMERTYDASIEDVWAMWTTKEGIESWWGPEGFRVEVTSLELAPGGALRYAMIAATPETVAFMEQAGMPTSTPATIRFTEVDAPRRLAYLHTADFIPGVAPYDVATVVELHPAPNGVKLVLQFDPMHETLWTERAVAGWTSELGKLETALATNHGGAR